MNTSLRRAMYALCVGALACIVIPSGPLLAQSNWQQQQQRQQDMQRQQQEQQRQQQQAQQRQQRQQMQDQQRQQMQAQQRQQMQEQQRQQMQAQQRQQMQQQQQTQQRQQMQTQQQTAEQQRRQMQQQGKLGTMQGGKPTGMVISGGVAKMNRPLTPGEIQRGFTGKVTADGRALIKFQNRVFTVPASRVSGLSARLAANQNQQKATRWTEQQHSVVNQKIKTLASANNKSPPSATKAGLSPRGASSGNLGCTPQDSPKCQLNRAAQARIDSARMAKVQNEDRLKNASKEQDEAFHYTFSEHLASMKKDGLRPGTYATPNGTLSPLQAHIDLALSPNRGLPNAVVRIDLAGLRAAGYKIPEVKQAGRSSAMPGGGTEMQFPYVIPPQFIKVIDQ